jgi:hypothetical protein
MRGKKNFTGGKTPKAPSGETPFDLNVSIALPGAEAVTDWEGVFNRFVGHRAASVKEEVSGDVVLHQGMVAFGDDHESLQQLLNALVGAKVLSQAEALAGLGGRKSIMSMLRKIAEYAHVILHPKILPFLQPGYSVLYQTACLYEDLEAINERD